MTASGVPYVLADLFLRSSLLLLVGWGAATAVGKAGGSAASRHLVWLLCLGALLLLPLLTLLLPPLKLPILPAETASGAAGLARSLPATIAPAAGTAEGDVPIVWAIYLLVAAPLAGRLLLGRWMLGRHWRRASAHPALVVPLEQLRARLGISRRVELRLRGGPFMPMTWGMMKPRILLPAEAARWPEERRRLVLLHELAHIYRFDSPVRLGAALACALYWFQPGIWFAMRRMRAEQEHASDDLVLAAGVGARSYAFTLLEAAGGHVPGLTANLAAAMSGTSELERRLSAIVGQGVRGRPGTGFVAGSSAAACLAALLVATAIPVPASGTIARPGPLAQAAAPTAIVPPPPARFVEAATGNPAAAHVAPAPAYRLASVAAPGDADSGGARETAPAWDYAAMAEAHDRDVAAYRRQLQDYYLQRDDYQRQVEKLRREGNLANSGNSGNSGNEGNYGNAGGAGQAATPPTAPTPPTSPTPPAALRPVTEPNLPVLPAEPAQGP